MDFGMFMALCGEGVKTTERTLLSEIKYKLARLLLRLLQDGYATLVLANSQIP
jgi:hypothetical protein